MEARLTIIGGHSAKKEIVLQLPATIGRSRAAGLTIAHGMVSRQHCELFEAHGLVRLRDLGSLNGTFCDGKQIKETALRPGDQFTVGPLTFRIDYAYEGDSTENAPVVPETGVAPEMESTTYGAPDDEGNPFFQPVEEPAAQAAGFESPFSFLEEPAAQAAEPAPSEAQAAVAAPAPSEAAPPAPPVPAPTLHQEEEEPEPIAPPPFFRGATPAAATPAVSSEVARPDAEGSANEVVHELPEPEPDPEGELLPFLDEPEPPAAPAPVASVPIPLAAAPASANGEATGDQDPWAYGPPADSSEAAEVEAFYQFTEEGEPPPAPPPLPAGAESAESPIAEPAGADDSPAGAAEREPGPASKAEPKKKSWWPFGKKEKKAPVVPVAKAEASASPTFAAFDPGEPEAEAPEFAPAEAAVETPAETAEAPGAPPVQKAPQSAKGQGEDGLDPDLDAFLRSFDS